MQQIADWLKTLGLAQYAQRFAENDINFAIRSDLSDQDLKELGVSSLGHRRQLLGAIAEISRAEQDTPATAATASVAQQPHDAAERRQVTVMFSDLVGSTALSAHMDPEDLREIISAYQKCVAETVVRFGGFVAKYMGDGVLVYFGYPQAHEDDAERAVRAGLGLIAAVTALKLPVSLQTRVGIATGLVVVGDLIGSGEAQERGIVGETPNLAARLQAMAEPNTVVIAESTRQLLGNLFELEDLGAKDLKGIARPARAWAAIRASSVESRFEAMHSTGLTALVGREEELELLVRRWSRAKTGEGQVVLLSGEGGIGKSRLTAALLEHLATEPHTRLRYFCSPQHTDSAFYPIIGQMERAAGLAHGDTPQAQLDKLDAVLAQTSTSLEDAALFAEMLSLPNDGRYPALALSPVQRRQRTLEALTSQVAGLASQQPVLMIFEDAHWTDPTSLEAFGRAVDRVKTLPVLLIVTFRPEFNPPWVGQSGVTSATLNRLGEREAAAIIARLVGNKELPADVMAEIVERTDGIPLFVEEMTKAVLEAGSEGEARRTADQSHQLATETLELAERIDNDDARVPGHRTLGVSLFELGQLAEARRELEAAAELFDLRKKQRQSALASETRIMISTWLSYLLVFQGYFDDAIQAREIAWTEANASSALHTRAFSLGFGAALSYQIGDHQDFLNRAHALHALASEQALHFHKTIGLMYLGWCRMKLGDIDARSVFQEGLDGYRNSGSRWALPMWLGGFSVLLPDNDEQRVTILDQAFEAVESTQEQWYAAELHRLRGDFARTGRCPNDDLAEENYSTARRIAQEQGSMLLNLRASTSLALLLRDQGKIVEASDLLGPVYGWFTQGFNTPVLRRAKALLDKLS